MEAVDGAWSEDWETFLSSLKSTHQICGLCMLCGTKDSVLKCRECLLKMCQSCDIEMHEKFPIHNRQTFLKGFEENLAPNEVVNENNEVVEIGNFFSKK